MKFDTSQQISATYLRNNTSEIINQTIKEGMSVIVRRSKPTVIMLSMQEFEKLKNESKPKKHKKFNLEEIRKNSVYENIPVYALSANAMKNEVLRGKESGFKDYLT